MMGCLSQFGKLGLTSIGNSPEQAEEIYQKVVDALDQETTGDNNSWGLPPTNSISWNNEI